MNKNNIPVGYGVDVWRLLCNIDHCSTKGNTQVVKSQWGTFKLYKKSEKTGHRYFSISNSKVFPNCGSYRIGSLKKMFHNFSINMKFA
jgi:hypothetical protein